METWQAKVASLDKTGALMKKMQHLAEVEQLMFDISQSTKRMKKVKPGLKLQERDRVVLQETVARSKWVHERPPLWPRNPPS